MKIIMPFYGRFPCEKPAAIFAACNGDFFVSHGCDFLLVAPRRFGREKNVSAKKYYSLYNDLIIKYLPTIDFSFLKLKAINRFVYRFGYLVFSVIFSIRYAFVNNAIYYSNEHLPLMISIILGKKCFFEVHDFPERKSFYYKYLFNSVKGLIVTNNWKKRCLIDDYNVPEKNILVVPNAIDLKKWTILDKNDSRQKLSINVSDKKIILYTGQFYSWKGVDILAEAAKQIDAIFYFIGGVGNDLKSFTNNYGYLKNVKIIGQRPFSEMPLWQASADVLVIPNSKKDLISSYFTSPMKLFEYLGAERPIVASNVSSIKEIVDESLVRFFNADEVDSLVDSINWTLNNYETACSMAKNGSVYVKQFSWENRTNKIIEFLTNHT